MSHTIKFEFFFYNKMIFLKRYKRYTTLIVTNKYSNFTAVINYLLLKCKLEKHVFLKKYKIHLCNLNNYHMHIKGDSDYIYDAYDDFIYINLSSIDLIDVSNISTISYYRRVILTTYSKYNEYSNVIDQFKDGKRVCKAIRQKPKYCMIL